MLLLFQERANDLNGFWSNVWNKVTASIIFAIIAAIFTELRFRWWERLIARWSVKVTMTNSTIGYQAGAGYPLKCHVEIRNDFSKCVEVRVVDYVAKNITLKSFPPEVMQLRFSNKWFPPDPEDKVAVLPGQLCRAWVGFDDTKFSEAQLNAARGSIGTLVVSANGKQFRFEL